MKLIDIIREHNLVIVTKPRLYQHIGDGYHEEMIADTIQGDTISIENDYIPLAANNGREPVYLARTTPEQLTLKGLDQ